MCGIAGIATAGRVGPSDANGVAQMLGALRHRGPDDQHVLADECAVLGARRLSIIDLSGGRQPLTDESGRIVATQNGEIYNYVELQTDLERRGHAFASHCDTETIVHLYEEYGTDFVTRLRGMFAIALWDGRRRRLVLARDRLGKKPLYWRLQDGRLSYSSELKGILADPEVDRRIDPRALQDYLAYQYVPSPRTILSGVFKLPPASLLIWDRGEPHVQRYWSPAYAPKHDLPAGEDVDEGLRILREAVRIRLRSDVPVGAFLSGGMDSSVVTALMAEASAAPINTYSIGFDSARHDELPYARAVARHLGTVHNEDVVTVDAIEMLPTLTETFDEPFGDSSAIPTLRVAQLAGASLKVVLTGDGGDESFGGYPRYMADRFVGSLEPLPSVVVRAGARSARAAAATLGTRSRLKRKLINAATVFELDRDERYLRRMVVCDGPLRQALLGRPDDASQYLLSYLRSGPHDPVDRKLRADLLTYLPEDLLVKVDRATMASSLEARAPLLDQELVEFAASLPSARKVRAGTTKVLLREMARRLLPAELVDRPKKGFAVPMEDWMRGGLGDCFADTVLAHDALSRDYLDTSVAARLLREHRLGVGRGHALWVLLMFELWARRWLGSTTSMRHVA